MLSLKIKKGKIYHPVVAPSLLGGAIEIVVPRILQNKK
jgi:hypothetical protein